MSLKNWTRALLALAVMTPVSAHALGISVASVTTSGGTPWLEDGDTVTIRLVLENATQESIAGLGVGVYGYDENVPGDWFDNRLRFVSGQSATQAFSETVLPTLGAFDGLANAVTSAQEFGHAFPILQERRVLLFNAVALTPRSGDASGDFGIGSDHIYNGDVHMEVTFQAVALGASPLAPAEITLEFGVGQWGNVAVDGDGNTLAFDNAFQTLTIVPEPGTALLMGLGLAGLATRRR